MKDYQLRVIDEKAELDAKIAKLKLFIYAATFESLDSSDKALLKDQFNVMTKYSNILADRIERFT